MSTETGSSALKRLFHLDNLRVFLTVLVILHHASIAYGGGGDWAVEDPAVDEISPIFLTYFTAVNQTYFMSAFFLLAGYFTPRSLEKKGARSFLADRLIRLGIPLLIYTTLIINLNQWMSMVWMRGHRFRWLVEYNPGHLWFLQALLLFAVVYVLYRQWADRTTGTARFRYWPDRFPPDRALVLSIVVLTLLTFAVRVWFPVGEWVFGFQLAHFVHYLFSFFVGVLAYHGDWFNRLQRPQARSWGIVALVTLPVFLVVAILGGALESDAAVGRFLGGMGWQSMAYAAWESTMFIAVLTYLLYLFRERFSQAGPLLRSMAKSVYTVYIIHQTLVIALHITFLSVAIPTLLKFLLVSLIAVPACFLLAGLIRRLPYADRVLG
jgi:surface polysaccharide O-acyltransferase-like enzyme